MPSGDVLVLIDEDGRVVEWRSQAEQLFGWTAEEAVGQAVTELVRGSVPTPRDGGRGSRPRPRCWSDRYFGAPP